MHLDPNIALLAIITCGAGYLMTLAGLSKSALELKRKHRICPSCGREIEARVCRACTR
jgi:NADH pyrophosphatase NudC (nudix superfamily)